MTDAPTIPRLFDSAAQRRNRTRAAAGFGGFDFLKREAVLRMADRLALMRRDFPLCLDFGCHDGMLTREIMGGGKIGRVIQADPAPACAAQRLKSCSCRYMAGARRRRPRRRRAGL